MLKFCPGYKYKDAVMSFICTGFISGFECKQLSGFRNLSAAKQPGTPYSGNLVQRDNMDAERRRSHLFLPHRFR